MLNDNQLNMDEGMNFITWEQTLIVTVFFTKKDLIVLSVYNFKEILSKNINLHQQYFSIA